MQVAVQDADRPTFGLTPSDGDDPAALPRRELSVETAGDWRLDHLHPDLLALALLLVARPATTHLLQVPRPVSHRFAAAVEAVAGLRIGPVDDHLEPRSVPVGGVPGLSFSGGVDSTAALRVLPDDTRSYFLERVVPAGAEQRLLSPAAGLAAATGLRASGRDVRIVRSDLEYLRTPPGFPEHYANAVPLLLHADHDGLATAGWGLVAESAYRFGRARFVDYLERGYNRRWHTLFAAAGLPMCNPVMGVSEVGTTLLTAGGPLAHLAQSCVRGPLGEPCGACVKCFRKRLVEAAVLDQWPEDGTWRTILASYPVRSYLDGQPLHQPAGVIWSLQRYPGRDPLLRLLSERLDADATDVGFMTRWYPPAAAHWPDVPWVAGLRERLDDHLGAMDETEQARLESFDLTVREARPEVVGLTEAMTQLAERRAALFVGGRSKPVGRWLELEERLAASQEALQAAEQERDLALQRLEAARASTSYRVGHAIVRASRPLRPGRERGRPKG